MVSHPAADYFVARPAETAAEDRIVDGFIESISPEPSQSFHAAQILYRCRTVDIKGEKRGVGRNHQRLGLLPH